MTTHCSAAVLWGGQSSRMGQDKGFLPLTAKECIIDRIITTLSLCFEEIILVAPHLEYQQKTTVKIVPDEKKGCGPMGGIASALKAATHPFVFITACDTPFLRLELIHLFLNHKEGCRCIVGEAYQQLQPFPSLWHKDLLPAVDQALLAQRLKVSSFYATVNTTILKEAQIKKADPLLESYINLNTPEDYQKVLNLASQSI